MNSPALRPHRGTLILVLGILSLVVCGPLGIASWVMGNADLAEMAAGRMDPSGEGLTRAGKICGIVGVAFLVLGVLIAIFLFGVAGVAAVGANK